MYCYLQESHGKMIISTSSQSLSVRSAGSGPCSSPELYPEGSASVSWLPSFWAAAASVGTLAGGVGTEFRSLLGRRWGLALWGRLRPSCPFSASSRKPGDQRCPGEPNSSLPCEHTRKFEVQGRAFLSRASDILVWSHTRTKGYVARW